ncbi:Aste57867_10116 [Aphanomyces stellatus]|uniref:Aste57867_10116 protein n=1 Tax=Aphanomyces stellatus TaxID=120398 RepID=A0A485KQH9_9STRA|nr:hypothetical protein As57867_010077 [Aphanomyces stellatus]VFT86992.1 Aste57867_10116 [Aphanomyces stellatus]
MQAATDAVRRRWPLAAGVTATATALVYAGIHAYGTKPLENEPTSNSTFSDMSSSNDEAMTAPLATPRTPSPKKRAHASVIHAPIFRYFLWPIVLGTLVGMYIVLLHFEVIDVSVYPSAWDMLARGTLLSFGLVHSFLLWPFLTDTPTLRTFRANVVEWLATSSSITWYISMHSYSMLTLVLAPIVFISLELNWGVVDWADCQFYVLLAAFDTMMANVLWHLYTLVHLNSNLRHI